MSAAKSTIELKPGDGAGSHDPHLTLKLKMTSGVGLVLYSNQDRSSKEGRRDGVFLHLLKGISVSDISKRLEASFARFPNLNLAKLVALDASDELEMLRQVLKQLEVTIHAEVAYQCGQLILKVTPVSGALLYLGDGLQALASKSKTRTLIVDDSASVRKLLRKILSADPEIEIVGEADGVRSAESQIRTLKPQVVTLDLHMPDGTGVDLLRKLDKESLPKVILVTSVSMEEGDLIFDAFSLGAVDYIQKPSLSDFAEIAPLVCERVRGVAQIRTKNLNLKRTSLIKQAACSLSSESRHPLIRRADIIAIGASTGGVQALTEILTALPERIPPILIVQHIPPGFSAAFAARLNASCRFEVREACDGDRVCAGQVLLAPGGRQMKIEPTPQGGYVVRVYDGPRVKRHRPSVEVLFESVARHVGAHSVGIILTGMGDDGSDGLLQMKSKGALTLAQDEASCVVFGMPKVAIAKGGATRIIPLQSMAAEIAAIEHKG
jgi:two-component system chemotaxis response regulator CheB